MERDQKLTISPSGERLDFAWRVGETSFFCIQQHGAGMHDSEELNRLVRELNERRGTEPTDVAATARLDQWLTTLVARAGSDLLPVENAPPCMRVQGELRKIEANALDRAELEAGVGNRDAGPFESHGKLKARRCRGECGSSREDADIRRPDRVVAGSSQHDMEK